MEQGERDDQFLGERGGKIFEAWDSIADPEGVKGRAEKPQIPRDSTLTSKEEEFAPYTFQPIYGTRALHHYWRHHTWPVAMLREASMHSMH
ncbi:hypothetical protein VNO77_34164 [Canavalia gladiata]|uniref:Uncharacterized protein n=1 Tax=Canavalia gladiata TaxID=3824 RepID=A0AAN9Q1I5_CANGL